MPDYRIRVITSAETVGLQQTQQATDNLTKSTRDLNAELAKSVQTWRDGQQPAVANAAAITKAGDAADKAAGAKSRLVEAMKKAQAAVPGLNFALASVTNIWALLAAATVGAISKIREWDEIVTQNENRLKAFRDLNKEVERFSDNIKQARLDAEEFNRELEAAKSQDETPEEEGQRTSRSTQRRFARRRAQVQAQRGLALDQIARRVATGRLDEAGADRERLVVGRRFDREDETLNLSEQAELAFIARRVAAAEGGRAAQLQGRLPGAEAEALGARNRLDDARRALQAALDFAGVDADLKPLPGGRMAQIQGQLAPGNTPGGIASWSTRQKLRQEQESLRAGILQQRRSVTEAESASAAAQGRLSSLRGSITSAAENAGKLRGAAIEQTADFQGAAATAAAVGPINQERFATQTATALAQASAKANEELSRKAEEVVRTLGRATESTDRLVNEARALLQRTVEAENRAKTRLQTE